MTSLSRASKLLGGIVLALSLCMLSLQAQAVEPGKTYYTMYNVKTEKNKVMTTNYWRGELIPINTKVTLESINDKKMVLLIDERKITFKNVQKYTLRSMQEIADMYLGHGVDLTGYSSERRNEIKNGVLRLGMTKDEVLMTRGYPPRHETPSTNANTWKYWSSRYVTRTLVFRDGKLVEGRGIN
ncbi:MAG: hypothetical protein CSB44_04540 [Gammaproteobacteria bacterium]|nr:MAG: hypothetical protein CSB44_04540 [Gammaproteobacteria bacterium]